MLVLTRRLDEKLEMTCADGTKIVIEILNIHGSQVRIGINAPKNVNILRSEAKIKEEISDGTDNNDR